VVDYFISTTSKLGLPSRIIFKVKALPH